MALVLSEEQEMLRDSARGFLAESAPVSALRKLRDDRDETGFSRDLWKEMAEMGWAGILVDEAHGGADFGFVGAGVIAEEEIDDGGQFDAPGHAQDRHVGGIGRQRDQHGPGDGPAGANLAGVVSHARPASPLADRLDREPEVVDPGDRGRDDFVQIRFGDLSHALR